MACGHLRMLRLGYLDRDESGTLVNSIVRICDAGVINNINLQKL